MRVKRKKQQESSPPEQESSIPGTESVIVSDVFAFEHRNSQGKLLTRNKDLKTKTNIRGWLKRKLKLA